ncbi:MAG: DMT family transporter [Roseiflexaceae bacterium]
MTTQRSQGYLLVVVAALIWSLTSPGLSYLLKAGAHPLGLAFWRDAVIATACVLGLLIFRPHLLKVDHKDLLGLALTGMISIGIYHALWVWSIDLNGAAVAIVMIYLFPTFVSVGSWLIFKEPLRWPQVLALAISLVGCGLLVRIYDPELFRLSWLGTLVGLLTAITHTVYVLYSQRSVQERSPWTSMTYTMLFGSMTLLIMLLLSGGWGIATQAPQPWQVFSLGEGWQVWLVLAFIALGPTMGGYGIFTSALRSIPARLASLIVVIEAPISTMIAVLWIGERLEWPQVVGMALILSSIAIPTLMDQFLPKQVAANVAAEPLS